MISITIKTAQGYLSFNPSVEGNTANVEYRPQQGGWETIELPGLEEGIKAIVEEALANAGISTPPDENGGNEGSGVTDYPYGIVPSENSDYVYAIKQALIADGKNLSGPCGAFEICRNVAMGLREIGCGLLEKTSGNNCQQRSTDIVCYKDFSAGATRLVDILSDAGGANTPMWTEKGPEENVEMERWMDPALSTPTEGG